MIRPIFISFLIFCCAGAGLTQILNQQADIISNIETLISQGAFEEALVFTDQIIRDDSLNIEAALCKYQILRAKRKMNSAYRIAKANFKTFKEKAIGLNQIKLYLNRAETYMIFGKTEKGLNILKSAKSLIDKISEINPELNLYADFIEGIYLSKTYGKEDHRVEIRYLNTFNKLKALPQPDPYLLSQLLHYLGIIHQSQGNFEKALDYFLQEKDIYRLNYPSNHFDIGVAYYSIGNVCYELMEYQMALDNYLPAYEIWRYHYQPTDKYMRHLTEAIGDMYWELGLKKEALPFYNLSAFEKENSSHPKLTELRLADSLAQGNQYEKAMNIYGEALSFRLAVYGDKHAVTGACQNQIANAFLRKGELENALNAYQIAMTMLIKDFDDTSASSNPESDMQVFSEKYLLESLVGKTLTLKALYEGSNAKDDLELAFKTAQKAIEILEKLRRSPLSETSSAFWTKKYFTLYDTAVELAYEKYGNSKEFIKIAFPIIENSKALLLQNALRFNNESSFLDIPKSITSKENQLKKSIQEYIIRIDQEENQCENAQLKKLEIWNQELMETKLRYDVFLNELKVNYPKYYSLKYGYQNLDMEEVKNRVLKNDQSLIIEFFEGEHFIYVLAFSNHNDTCFRLSKDSLFNNQLNQFYESLYNINKSLENPDQQFEIYAQNAFALYERLLHPALNYFPDSIHQLLIIPDKQLFYLPFEALITKNSDLEKDYRRLPYLLNGYQLSYSQSAQVLAWSNTPQKEKRFKYNYLGFAPDHFSDKGIPLQSLSWNHQEVLQAEKTWNGKAYIQSLATRDNFIQNASQGKIQHFATHALLDNENPMLSRIVFQGDSNNLLFTYDLYSLPIQSELIVLTACNTGRGNWQQGEGMISLERAFQFTGCSSLLTSIWSIDDQSTSGLTIDFFKELQKGKSKDKALAIAKRRYLKYADPGFGHPYYWAALRLIGNVDPVLKTDNHLKKLWISFLLLFMIFSGFLLWKFISK